GRADPVGQRCPGHHAGRAGAGAAGAVGPATGRSGRTGPGAGDAVAMSTPVTTDRSFDEQEARAPVLSPVDRVSEMLFGLFMALTFVGAVSVADAGRENLREMFGAALGCNLAWGLVDAV